MAAVDTHAKETKPPPPVDAHHPPHDGKTDDPNHRLQTTVQDIHAHGGNLKASTEQVARGHEEANKVFGHVQLHDDTKPAAKTDGKPDDHPKPADTKAPEKAPEAKPPEHNSWSDLWNRSVNWAEHKVESAEKTGAAMLHSAEQSYDSAKHTVGAKIDQFENKAEAVATKLEHKAEAIGTSIEHKAESVAAAVTNKDNWHNIGDIAATLAVGVKDAAVKTATDLEHGVEKASMAAVHGVEAGAEWAYHNPGKAAAIVGVAAAIVGAEVLSGGAATAVIAPLLAEGTAAVGGVLGSAGAATAMNAIGVGAAVIGTAKAGVEVYKGGEVGVLMNQQNMTPEQVAAAHKALKDHTGTALLGDSILGAGYIASGIQALRAGATVEGAVTDATTATTAVRATTAAGSDTATATTATTAAATDAAAGTTAAGGDAVATADASRRTLAPLLDKVKKITENAGKVKEVTDPYRNGAGAVSSVKGMIKDGSSIIARFSEGSSAAPYAVAAGDKRGTNNNNDGRSTVPDEATKH